MPINDINLGNSPNDGNGDSLRIGGEKINANFLFLDQKIDQLNFLPVINGYATLKLGGANKAAHEVGDVIAGVFSPGRFIIAEITALPIAESDLQFYLDNLKST